MDTMHHDVRILSHEQININQRKLFIFVFSCYFVCFILPFILVSVLCCALCCRLSQTPTELSDKVATELNLLQL